MRMALLLAEEAVLQQEVPVGAILVYQNRIIGSGWNQPIQRCDPTAHAEILVLRQAALKEGNYRLPETTLYVTLEPCAMCLGALLQARVQCLVFGARDPKAGAVVSVFALLEAEALNHRIEWREGILATEGGAVLKKFFREKRQRNTVLSAIPESLPGLNPAHGQSPLLGMKGENHGSPPCEPPSCRVEFPSEGTPAVL